MSENLNNNSTPSASQIQAELKRIRSKREYGKMLRGTIFTLVAVAAAAVLISVLFLPVLRVTGSSMESTLYGDDLVVCRKGSDFETGDIVAFYFNNKAKNEFSFSRALRWCREVSRILPIQDMDR